MKKLLPVFLALFTVQAGFGWSQKGHDAVAYIASRHLTPATVAQIDSLLDGYSIVYWANWLDNASHTPEYEYTKTWHYKNIDEDMTYETAPNIPEGNIVEAVYDRIEALRDTTLSKDDRALALKMVVHRLVNITEEATLITFRSLKSQPTSIPSGTDRLWNPAMPGVTRNGREK